MPTKQTLPAPVESIERRIYLIRSQKVMLDADLAELYQVSTKVFNQAVQRNKSRFPADFMFRLTKEEAAALRSQIVTLEPGRGKHSKYAPYAFTEHGVAMLSAVLRSKKAVEMNILIVRAFIKLREVLAAHQDLAARMDKLEATQKQHSTILVSVVEEIKRLKAPLPATPPKRRIGFKTDQQQ